MFEGTKSVGNRPVGVAIPEGQRSTGRGQPRTVRALTEMKTYGAVWVDDNGAEQTEVIHRMGDLWYRAPNGVNYAATLKSLKPETWLAEALNEQLASDAPSVIPAQDAVDIGDEP